MCVQRLLTDDIVSLFLCPFVQFHSASSFFSFFINFVKMSVHSSCISCSFNICLAFWSYPCVYSTVLYGLSYPGVVLMYVWVFVCLFCFVCLHVLLTFCSVLWTYTSICYSVLYMTCPNICPSLCMSILYGLSYLFVLSWYNV